MLGDVNVTSVRVNSNTIVSSLWFSSMIRDHIGIYTCWGVNDHNFSSVDVHLGIGELPGKNTE